MVLQATFAVSVCHAVIAQEPAAQVPAPSAAQTPAAPPTDMGADAKTAMNPQDPQTPLLHLEVRRVPVDVVVLDQQGNPVRGLKEQDFEVKEDSKPQSILSFDETDSSKASFIPPKLPTLPADTFVDLPDAPERGPLYILYYDLVNTSMDDQMQFRRALLKFIDDAQQGTRMALFVNAAGLHLVQGFTSDHALLHAAVDRKGPGPHIPPVFTFQSVYGGLDASAALSNLKFIAEYVDGLPGRKNLIWMASNFPIPAGPSMQGSQAIGMASAAPVVGQVGAGGGPQALDLVQLLSETIKHTYAAMMRAQIALYPVSLRGVEGGGSDGGAADAQSDYANLDMIAAATGGHAYFSSNRPELLLDKAVEHGENYYTLSYSPSNKNYDGSERHIQVSVAGHKDYTVTYRTVYYALSDDAPAPTKTRDVLHDRFAAAKASDTLYANIEHGAPMLHDLLFSAHLAVAGKPQMATPAQMQQLENSPAFFRTRKKDRPLKPLEPVKLQKYRIDYGVIDPQLKSQAQQKGAQPILEFAAAAYDADGKLLNSELNDGTPAGAGKSDGKSSATFRAEQELNVPPGAASIRVAVRDKATNRTGTLEVTLPLKGGKNPQVVSSGQ
jgi:VWFA-related protein